MSLQRMAAAAVFCFAAAAQAPSDDLFQAVRKNDLPSLRTRLARGTGVNSRDSRGNTLLMQAAELGSADAVKLLLDSGADVNARNPFNVTALLRAATDPAKVRILLESGADVNATSKQGRTPLMIAATCDGCVETVWLLIAKGARVTSQDGQGRTALYSAVEANDLETMRLLVEKGASASAPDASGWTPLMSAATKCNNAAIKFLLSKGAVVNSANIFGGEVKFGKIMLTRLTPLMNAAAYCPAEVIQTLLSAGAEVNAIDSRNMTPLMFAVASEHQDAAVVKLLLDAGSKADLASSSGETALDWANKFGDLRVIAALTAAGAQPGPAFTPPKRKQTAARTPAEAAQIALKLLQRSSTEFFQKSGCVGCHHQPIATMAFAAARAGGVPADAAAGHEHVKMIESELTGALEFHLQHAERGGFTDPPAFELMALHRAGYTANAVTDAAALYVAGAQLRNGTWMVDGASRSPIQEGLIGRAAMSARVLQLYGPPARKGDLDVRVGRTRAWLLEAKAITNDDLAMRLMGLHWFGAGAERAKAAAAALLATQREDGGWGQNPNLPSDAYATGQSLTALRESGALRVADAAYQRGVKFLLSTQWEDGSWYVRSRAVKLQPYFQSGFPFEHDQWISAAGTAYAVMALSAK